MSSVERKEATGPVKWIELPPAALKGEGLGPYNMEEFVTLVDWVENKEAGAVHYAPHHGQFLVDVVEAEPNAVHNPSKTGDEFILVLKGILSLTTDATNIEQRFNVGDMVMIPAGWAGIFRALPEDGVYRELAIVPGNYFDRSSAPPAGKQSPRLLELPPDPGMHTVHTGAYTLEAQNSPQSEHRVKKAEADEVIQILAGTLTLKALGESASFPSGSVLILPKGFEGELQTSENYRALNARWGN